MYKNKYKENLSNKQTKKDHIIKWWMDVLFFFLFIWNSLQIGYISYLIHSNDACSGYSNWIAVANRTKNVAKKSFFSGQKKWWYSWEFLFTKDHNYKTEVKKNMKNFKWINIVDTMIHDVFQ